MADNPNPNPVKDIKYGELNDITRPVLRKRLSPDSQDTIASMAIVAKPWPVRVGSKVKQIAVFPMGWRIARI